MSVAQNSKPLAWARYRAQTLKFSLRPRLGECLSPERETMSLNPFLGRLGENHEPELNVRLCNSRLGEMDPLRRDLQGFEFVHAHTSPKQYQNTNQSSPTQYNGKNISESRFISKLHYQGTLSKRSQPFHTQKSSFPKHIMHKRFLNL